MTHSAQLLRANHEEVRSSAEAALPPPSDRPDESVVRILGRTLAQAVEELTARINPPPANPAGPLVVATGSSSASPHTDSERIRLFGTVLASLVSVDPGQVAPGRAGLGSSVEVRDTASGETLTFEILPLELVDGSPGRVTLASPLGQQLAGAAPGDTLRLTTPSLARTVRVERVMTIWDAVAPWLRDPAGESPAG